MNSLCRKDEPAVDSDFWRLRRDCFLLWRPAFTDPTPALVIGALENDQLGELRTVLLAPVQDRPDLWGVAARDCDLRENTLYAYWFQVRDSDPYLDIARLCLCTDPMA